MKPSKLQKTALVTGLVAVLGLPGQAVPANAAAKKYVKSLSVTSKVSLTKGKKKTITVKVKTVKKASKKVSVKVGNKKIVKVTYSPKKNKLTVYGKKQGTTSITLTTKDKNKKGKKLTKKITVSVKNPAASNRNGSNGGNSNSNSTGQGQSQGSNGGQSQTPHTPAKTAVTKIRISQDTIRQMKGTSATLTAFAEPDNADDKTILWSSSNERVAKVSSDGIVTLLESGTAQITAKNPASGVTAHCSVFVLDTMTATTQEELNQALVNDLTGKIILKPAAGSEISVPEGSYSGISLEIAGAGDASVKNYGMFDGVMVCSGTYEEHKNNSLSINGASDIKISNGITCDVIVNLPKESSEKNVNIENNGTISRMAIASEAVVKVTGSSNGKIPVGISDPNVKFISDQNLDVSLTAPAKLVFTGDVDDTSIKIDKAESMPVIEGVGTFQVLNSATNETTPVLATPSDELGKVTVKGSIVSAYDSEKALEDVIVLLARDSEGTDIVKFVRSNDKGEYSLEDVASGNYYLIMKREGYKDARQLVAASSRFNSVYENETMEMIPSDVEDQKTGQITGVITNAEDKSAISGVTVELRKDKGNILGEPVKTTVTNESGEYSFDGLEAEQYTVRFVDTRKDVEVPYISKFVNTCVKHDQSSKVNTALSKPVSGIGGKGLRFVLTWGNSDDGDGVPEDLDSHIFGPSLSGSGMHEVYYKDQDYGAGVVYTTLDVDETDYNGPETTTIQKAIDGTYYYYVYRYSNDGTLQDSKAKVDVYAGDELLTTYNVPISGDGDDIYWKVCSYNTVTDEFQSYNTIEKKLSVPGLDLQEDVREGCSDCEHGMQPVLQKIGSKTDDALVSQNISDDDGYIKLKGTKNWADIKDSLTYQCSMGYTVEYQEPTEEEISETDNNDYRVNVIVKSGGEVIIRYQLFYQKVINITVAGDGVTRSEYLDYDNDIILYCADDIDLSSLTYTCSDSDYECKWQEDDLYLVDKSQPDEATRIYIEKYEGMYIKDVVGTGIDTFNEYSYYIDVYSVNDKLPEDVTFQCANGYTAEIGEDDGDKVLLIKNANGEIVKTKSIYVY